MKRILVVVLLCFAVAPALAGDPGLKPPAASIAPEPAQPQATVPAFYLVPAQAMARIAEIIEGQKRELERLHAIIDKGSCS